MNTHTHTLLLAALLLGGSATAEPIGNRITAEELIARRQANGSPLARLHHNPAEKRMLRANEQSIIAGSSVINDGQHWTIVPQGAVLHVPESLATRVGHGPSGTLLSWQEFLVRNTSWLNAQEISVDQALGEQPIAESLQELWTRQNQVVVAVHLGGPISRIQPETVVTQNR